MALFKKQLLGKYKDTGKTKAGTLEETEDYAPMATAKITHRLKPS